MKSKVVKLNVYAILIYVLALTTTFKDALKDMPAWVTPALVIFNIALSEFINRFYPSGTFVTHGRNWSPVKWIFNIGSCLLVILQSIDYLNVIPQSAMLIIVPAIQGLIRMVGGATRDQKIAYHRNK